MSASVKSLGDGWYLVEENGRQTRVAIATEAGATWAFSEGVVSRVVDETRSPGRARSKTANEVMSPMPATVVSINVAAGDSVTEGQTLVVLEAMKMELPIKAPRTGVVKAIHCAKGDLVQPGVNLLQIG